MYTGKDMEVNIIGKTYFNVDCNGYKRDGLKTIAAAARQYDIMRSFDITDEAEGKFVMRITSSGHTSILEHASASFTIKGVSRTMTHQLVRHRLASYTQQSQRYCTMDNFQYVVPPRIKRIPRLLNAYNNLMREVRETYSYLQNEMEKEYNNKQIANEDARFVLPNASETNITVTMNYRELIHFLGLRMCTRAQWEIRSVATEIYNIMCKEEPYIFGDDKICRGPKCKTIGYCEEAKSCGMMPKLSDILENYHSSMYK